MYNIQTFNLKQNDAIVKTSSTGWLLKWKQGDYWIKSPGYLFDYGWEPLAEALACSIAIDLGLKSCLEYRLCIINLDGIKLIGCISRNYKAEDLTELTITKLINMHFLNKRTYFGYNGYKELIEEIKSKFNLDIQSYLEDMILLDSIILNTDRNLWNISIMSDKYANGYIAPIYDFGNSLGVVLGKQGEFIEETMYSEGVHVEPFESTYEEELKFIRNDREYAYNKRLVNTESTLDFIYNNFTTNHNTYEVVNPLPEEVFNYMKQVIDKRYNTVIINKAWRN